ncbi:unnamed protein product, partial [Mesorhabditis spiculigera]
MAPEFYPADLPAGAKLIRQNHVRIWIHKEERDVRKIYGYLKSPDRPSEATLEARRCFKRERMIHDAIEERPCKHLLTTVPDSLRIFEHGDYVYGILRFPYMDYTLEEVRDNPRLYYSAADVLSAAMQLTTGLTHLHDKLKIIHRDLKLQNVFLDRHGTVKIGDFNISLVAFWTDPDRLTGTGTTHCMDPRALVDKTADFACDIWGLAVALWELTTREQCFRHIPKEKFFEFHRRNEWVVPPLNGQHFIVDFIRACSEEASFRRSAADLSKIINQHAEKNPPLFKRRFDVVNVESSELLKPSGLEHLKPGSCAIYEYFRRLGPCMQNLAEESDADVDAIGGSVHTGLSDELSKSQSSNGTLEADIERRKEIQTTQSSSNSTLSSMHALPVAEDNHRGPGPGTLEEDQEGSTILQPNPSFSYGDPESAESTLVSSECSDDESEVNTLISTFEIEDAEGFTNEQTTRIDQHPTSMATPQNSVNPGDALLRDVTWQRLTATLPATHSQTEAPIRAARCESALSTSRIVERPSRSKLGCLKVNHKVAIDVPPTLLRSEAEPGTAALSNGNLAGPRPIPRFSMEVVTPFQPCVDVEHRENTARPLAAISEQQVSSGVYETVSGRGLLAIPGRFKIWGARRHTTEGRT